MYLKYITHTAIVVPIRWQCLFYLINSFDEYEIGMHKVGLTAVQAALVWRRYVKK
jgi:hypothetical protein